MKEEERPFKVIILEFHYLVSKLEKCNSTKERLQACLDMSITIEQDLLEGNAHESTDIHIDNYYKWLDKEKERLTNLLEIENTTHDVKTSQNIEPNPFPRIFTNYQCYLFFVQLKEKMVKEKSSYADYSFIFNKMLSDGYLQHISHQVFITYLNENHSADFDYNQFKSGETSIKKTTYSLLKDNFKLP